LSIVVQQIDMPPLGQTTDTLLIVEWFKREGDRVKLGEPLFSVATDKAQVDVESVASGTLLKVLCEAGESVQAGSPVAFVGAPGEAVPDAQAGGGELTGSGGLANAAVADEAGPATSAPSAPGDRRPQGGGPGRVAALPAARRRAGELGVDLNGIMGTGPDGVVTVRDVEQVAPVPPTQVGDSDLIAVPQLRQVIARRMSASAQRIPQFTLTMSVDLSAARDILRAPRTESAVAAGTGLTYTHLIVRAVAAALREYPTLNRLWVDDGPRFRQLRRSDVGLAVTCDDGLRVVSLPEADQVSLTELARLIAEAADRARSGSFLAGDRRPVAVTVSNLGMHGVEHFQALVDPEQTSLLAVGAAEDRPVARDDAVAILPMLRVSLSVDHRVADGALAAQFLQAIKRSVERPGEATR
jgi:pyruvate dehydrogenase E2 component (dihydrolipoamide acetyltransferase)